MNNRLKHYLCITVLFSIYTVSFKPAFAQIEAPPPVQSLSGAIDAKQYMLGPGDVLYISVLSQTIENVYPLRIQPEGVIIIPRIGNVSLSGMTLHDAKKVIEDKLKKLYPGSMISTTLTILRTFKVYVTGEVGSPGSVTANAITRVSDILQQSGGLKNWADERAIEIRHKDGTALPFDYLDYKMHGHQEKNPFVSDGDEIHVPGVYYKGIINLQTFPEQSGSYPFYDGETVFDFLQRISFNNIKLDWERIAVIRDNAAGTQDTLKFFNVFEEINKFVLQPDDILAIPQFKQFVYVEGEVFKPGEIPWVVDRTATHYVGIAGRSPDAVGDAKIIIVRSGDGEKIEGSNTVIFPGDKIFVPKRRLLIIKDWLEFITPIATILIAGKAVGIY